MENGLSIAEKIVAIVMILGSAIGTLYTAISTSKRAKQELAAKIKKEEAELESDLEAEKIEKEVRKVELASQLKAFYDSIIEEMNEKSRQAEKEIQTLREAVQRHAKELEAVKIELSKVKKEKETLRDAGLLLIRAIEESIVSRDPDCLDPVHVNTDVLKTLNEVKILFENGNDKN